MRYYFKEKEISKKQAIEILGESKFESRVQDAIEEWSEDPLTIMSWMDGFMISNDLQ